MKFASNRKAVGDTKACLTYMKNSLKLIALLALGAGGVLSLPTGCAGTATRESSGEYVDDASITTKVKAAFVKDEVVKAMQVDVTTFKGVVQLSGFVDTAAQKERAGQVAAAVANVRSVQNNITVK
jgi:hyperosmotically inducible protein